MQVDEISPLVDGRLDRMRSLEDTWARVLQPGTAEQALRAARPHHQPTH